MSEYIKIFLEQPVAKVNLGVGWGVNWKKNIYVKKLLCVMIKIYVLDTTSIFSPEG